MTIYSYIIYIDVSQYLHDVLDNDDQNMKCSLMNSIVDQSEAFLKNGNDNI